MSKIMSVAGIAIKLSKEFQSANEAYGFYADIFHIDIEYDGYKTSKTCEEKGVYWVPYIKEGNSGEVTLYLVHKTNYSEWQRRTVTVAGINRADAISNKLPYVARDIVTEDNIKEFWYSWDKGTDEPIDEVYGW